MFLSLFFVIFAAACFFGLTRDAGASSFIVVVGFLQDPARKLVTGEPIVMSIMVGFVMACLVVRRIAMSNGSFSEPFTRWSVGVETPLKIYLIIIFLQGVHSYIRYGSLFLTSLGAIFYLAPLVAIVVGYSQFGSFRLVRGFLIVCCGFATITAVSVLISFYGYESDLLGEVGAGLIIYDQGTILKAYSGLMRSSEIASWHMGAGVCFLIILIVDKGSLQTVVFATVLIVLLVSAIILTGRRKMILQILIFCVVFLPVLQFYQGRISTRFNMLFVLAAGLFWFLATWYVPDIDTYDLYYARGASVFGEAGERFTSLGLGSIGWAYNQFGFFGGGLGVATQGAANFSGGVTSGAGEGGIGKLVSELGLVSLVFILWLGLAIARYLHSCLKLVSTGAPKRLSFLVGIAVFILANIPTFIVASQVYGDVFVLLILGLLSGAMFASPRQLITELTPPPRLQNNLVLQLS
jgi:hypothetical protein